MIVFDAIWYVGMLAFLRTQVKRRSVALRAWDRMGVRAWPHTHVWGYGKCRPAGLGLDSLCSSLFTSTRVALRKPHTCVWVEDSPRRGYRKCRPAGLGSDGRACVAPHSRVGLWEVSPCGLGIGWEGVRGPTLTCGVIGSVALRAWDRMGGRAWPHTHVWSYRKCRPAGLGSIRFALHSLLLYVSPCGSPTLAYGSKTRRGGVIGSVALRAWDRMGGRAWPHTHVWSYRKCRPAGWGSDGRSCVAPTLTCGVIGSVALRAWDRMGGRAWPHTHVWSYRKCRPAGLGSIRFALHPSLYSLLLHLSPCGLRERVGCACPPTDVGGYRKRRVYCCYSRMEQQIGKRYGQTGF
jgi:hypothetical protein